MAAGALEQRVPLHHATDQQDAEAIKVLLAAGADPMSSFKNGLTPIHVALKKIHVAQKHMLENVLDVFSRFPRGAILPLTQTLHMLCSPGADQSHIEMTLRNLADANFIYIVSDGTGPLKITLLQDARPSGKRDSTRVKGRRVELASALRPHGGELSSTSDADHVRQQALPSEHWQQQSQQQTQETQQQHQQPQTQHHRQHLTHAHQHQDKQAYTHPYPNHHHQQHHQQHREHQQQQRGQSRLFLWTQGEGHSAHSPDLDGMGSAQFAPLLHGARPPWTHHQQNASLQTLQGVPSLPHHLKRSLTTNTGHNQATAQSPREARLGSASMQSRQYQPQMQFSAMYTQQSSSHTSSESRSNPVAQAVYPRYPPTRSLGPQTHHHPQVISPFQQHMQFLSPQEASAAKIQGQQPFQEQPSLRQNPPSSQTGHVTSRPFLQPPSSVRPGVAPDSDMDSGISEYAGGWVEGGDAWTGLNPSTDAGYEPAITFRGTGHQRSYGAPADPSFADTWA
ncbi:uncharacterized protein MONBRDRAFT_37578 [Monosiga brevicollis MX1]|uniref:Uncharacterized protein n=1 Tax=Monosiga brevicollis TaxID=81824 RepID=A9V2M0_MONBE|nr:uncharacterized protein MONBRDRAFT_37578 [Monosiga brevicollis MX1]EDQ88399.1 predicted protein [Monosiga brevicollis MX1]|eukprot:XP_001746992.1 hypothetical protein [Monosiga brevicollis MX1]